MKNNKIEFRSTFELNEESRMLSGYGCVFESVSKDLGFYETIKRGAITQELVDSSDIILNYNHNDEAILGRSRNGQGTLKCTVDDKGLYFECPVPNTTLGNDIYESVKRNDLFECSFAFCLDPEDSAVQRWYKGEDGELYREINSIYGLFDIAICPHGAYGDTEVQARNKELAKEALEDIEKREQEAKEAEQKAKNDAIIASLNDRINSTLNRI